MRGLVWVKWPFILLVALFLVAPTVIVIVLSFGSSTILYFPPTDFSLRWYNSFFHDERWVQSALTSLSVALQSMLVATLLGTLMALGLVRGKFRGRGPVNALMLSPLVAPTVVVGLGMYMIYLRLHLTGTLPAFIVSHAVLGLPFVVTNVATGLRTVDRNVELAARNLGAGPIQAFVRITVPLILPGVLTGALFAFLTSFDEVVISMFLSSPERQTLPVVMFSGVQFGVDPTIAAASSLMTGFTFIVLLLLVLLRRGMGVARR